MTKNKPTNIKLKNNECAIVMSVDDWGVEFYLPQYKEDDDVPYPVVLLSVIAGLLNKQDPEFIEYMEKIVDKIIYSIGEKDGD